MINMRFASNDVIGFQELNTASLMQTSQSVIRAQHNSTEWDKKHKWFEDLICQLIANQMLGGLDLK